MDVLLCWSGERSRNVATCLKEWLPFIVQSAAPWLSPEDADKGPGWLLQLSTKLDALKLGVVCVTPENMQAPWLLFEAGALSKALDASCVYPVLFGLEPADLQGPLAQFRATRFARDDIRTLLHAVNRHSDSALGEAQIDSLFGLLWPALKKRLSAIEPPPRARAQQTRPVPELLTEVLDRVRSIQRELGTRTARQDAPVPSSRRAEVAPRTTDRLQGNLPEQEEQAEARERQFVERQKAWVEDLRLLEVHRPLGEIRPRTPVPRELPTSNASPDGAALGGAPNMRPNAMIATDHPVNHVTRLPLEIEYSRRGFWSWLKRGLRRIAGVAVS
jgi:hypothetical protein